VSRTPRVVLGILVAVLLAGNAVAYTQIDKTKYPSHWDKRIANLVTFVEDTRHLRFEHPVEVEFLTEAEYKKLNQTDESELSEEDKQDLKNFEGQAHALGLINENVDLLKQLNTIQSDATLAYYDDGAKKMVIRGTDLTVGLRVTIVHELTHALQDQVFGISRDFENDGASSFFHGLVEGDAVRVENAYVESLSQDEQDAYNEEDESSVSDAKDALADVPDALVQLFGAPYELGEPLTEMIVDQRGTKGLNKLFRVPADSDEGLISPFAALDNQHAKKVAAPKLKAGEKKTDDGGQFGVVPWFVVLSSFVDARTALAAVDGWGGDSYVGYRKDSRPCIRIDFEGDTPSDNVEMTNTLNQWKAPFTENTVVVTPTANGVELDACEPKVVPTPRADAGTSLELPVFRFVLLNLFSSSNIPRKLADCMTRHVIAIVPLDKLHSESEADQQQLSGIGQQVGRGCASGQLT